MTILRFTASADTTISNAYEFNLSTRGTGSNMGQSDILEVFSIYGQDSGSSGLSSELSRILVQFPISEISSKRAAGTIPASGSVNFVLKLYNAEHGETVPRNYKLVVSPVSQSWEEGLGLDMANYTDLTYDKEGTNWINAGRGATWTTEGGDYLSSDALDVSLDTGLENIEIDVSNIVEDWITGSAGGQYENYGFGVYLSSSYEASSSSNPLGAEVSYYTKKFFARGSEFYYYRPCLEARWDDSTKDSRGAFYFSGAIAPAANNLNKLYFHNYVKGTLQDIAGDDAAVPSVEIYYSSGSVPEGTAQGILNSSNVAGTSINAVRDSKGLYSATMAVTSGATTTTYPYLIDVWSYGGSQVRTGSAITPLKFEGADASGESKHVISIPNLYEQYKGDQTVRLRTYIRKKNWSPNIYNVAKNKPENLIIEDAAYRIVRIVDDFEVVPYGIGSIKFTSLSYDGSGNYFDLSMDLFETGYQYGIKFSIYNDYTKTYEEQPYMFKFRVVN
jgi:hypothetical protein